MLTRPTLALLTAVGLALASPALARQPESSSETRMTKTDGKTKAEVVIKDGKATATVNDKPVPADRIKMDEGRVRILDADGNTIAEFNDDQEAKGRAAEAVVRAEEARLRAQEARTRAGEARQRGREAELRALESEQRALLSAQRVLSSLDRFRGAFAGRENVSDTPPKVMMGVTLSSPDEALAEHFGLDSEEVTMIAGITLGLPADKAGIKRFDLVTEIEGKKPAGQNDLRKALRAKAPGDEIALTIISKGQTKAVTLKLEAFDAEKLNMEPAIQVEGEMELPADLDAGDAPPPPAEGFGNPGRRGTWIIRPGSSVAPIPPIPPIPPLTSLPGRGHSGSMYVYDSSRDLEKRLERLEEQLNRLSELLDRTAPAAKEPEKKDGGR